MGTLVATILDQPDKAKEISREVDACIAHTLSNMARGVPARSPRSVKPRQCLACRALREALEVGRKGLVIERALALLP